MKTRKRSQSGLKSPRSAPLFSTRSSMPSKNSADVVLDVTSLEEILGCENAQEFRLFPVIVPVEGDQFGQRLARTGEVERECLLAGNEVGIAIFDDLAKEFLLAGEVIIQHAVVALRRPADAVDAAPAIALAGEFGDRGT